jgi:alpha-methylacyl-CoA racemase
VAIAGVLGALGIPGDDRPAVPLNLVGDLAGGSMSVVLGIILALFARTRTGSGQVVDAAMVDGAAYLLSSQLAGAAAGQWSGRGVGMLSGAAPFYGVYRCADGRWMSLGAIEARFYRQALGKLGIDQALASTQHDRNDWPRARAIVAAAFRSRTRQQWTEVFAGSDACAYPVLEPDEVARDSHIGARETVDVSGAAATAPRLSRTPGRAGGPANRMPPRALLRSRGLTDHEIEEFRASGALHFRRDGPGGRA